MIPVITKQFLFVMLVLTT